MLNWHCANSILDLIFLNGIRYSQISQLTVKELITKKMPEINLGHMPNITKWFLRNKAGRC